MSLKDLLQEWPEPEPASSAPTWQPEPDAMVAGVVLGIRTIDTQYGDATIMTVDDEDLGPIDVFLTSAVLRHWMKNDLPQVGDTVGIKAFGQVESTKNPGKYYWNMSAQVLNRAGQEQLPMAPEEARVKPAAQTAAQRARTQTAHPGATRTAAAVDLHRPASTTARTAAPAAARTRAGAAVADVEGDPFAEE